MIFNFAVSSLQHCYCMIVVTFKLLQLFYDSDFSNFLITIFDCYSWYSFGIFFYHWTFQFIMTYKIMGTLKGNYIEHNWILNLTEMDVTSSRNIETIKHVSSMKRQLNPFDVCHRCMVIFLSSVTSHLACSLKSIWSEGLMTKTRKSKTFFYLVNFRQIFKNKIKFTKITMTLTVLILICLFFVVSETNMIIFAILKYLDQF